MLEEHGRGGLKWAENLEMFSQERSTCTNSRKSIPDRENIPVIAKGCLRAFCSVHCHLYGWNMAGELREDAGQVVKGPLMGWRALECCFEDAGEPGKLGPEQAQELTAWSISPPVLSSLL